MSAAGITEAEFWAAIDRELGVPGVPERIPDNAFTVAQYAAAHGIKISASRARLLAAVDAGKLKVAERVVGQQRVKFYWRPE